MTRSDCEESLESHLLSLNDAKYLVSIFTEEGLHVKDEWLFSIHKNQNGIFDRFEYNFKTNELKRSKKENEDSEFVSVDTSDIESNCIVDVSNDGMRWEGSCLNHSPFGPVCVMNESNELIYRGVMIGDKKECFGIEFYPDLDQIEYIGCYWNNERHGFGMLYDRKGRLVYKGDWLCGSNDYVINVILKDYDNVTDEEWSSEYEDYSLSYVSTDDEESVVKKNSFQNVNCLKISDSSVLKNYEIEDGEKNNYTCTFSFENVKSMMIESMFFDD